MAFIFTTMFKEKTPFQLSAKARANIEAMRQLKVIVENLMRADGATEEEVKGHEQTQRYDHLWKLLAPFWSYLREETMQQIEESVLD